MTGEVRTPSEVQVDEAAVGGMPTATGGVAADTGELAELKTQLEERTSDLQRVSAEYANYRRRVDRDRQLVVNGAKAQVVAELLGIVDDIERADAHGDLTGPFKAVADKLSAVLTNQGLEAFGVEGDEFDPQVHEAVQHATSPDVSGPTVTSVLRRGYKIGDRVVRTAMVGVTDTESGPPEAAPDQEN